MKLKNRIMYRPWIVNETICGLIKKRRLLKIIYSYFKYFFNQKCYIFAVSIFLKLTSCFFSMFYCELTSFSVLKVILRCHFVLLETRNLIMTITVVSHAWNCDLCVRLHMHADKCVFGIYIRVFFYLKLTCGADIKDLEAVAIKDHDVVRQSQRGQWCVTLREWTLTQKTQDEVCSHRKERTSFVLSAALPLWCFVLWIGCHQYSYPIIGSNGSKM